MSYGKEFIAALVWLVTSILRVAAAAVTSIVVWLAFMVTSAAMGMVIGLVIVDLRGYLASLPPVSSMSHEACVFAFTQIVVFLAAGVWAFKGSVFVYTKIGRCTSAAASWWMRVGKSPRKQRTEITVD